MNMLLASTQQNDFISLKSAYIVNHICKNLHKIINHPMYVGVPNIFFNIKCTYEECTEKRQYWASYTEYLFPRGKTYSGQN